MNHPVLYADCYSDRFHECLYVTEETPGATWRVCIYGFEFIVWSSLQEEYLNELQFEIFREQSQVDREILSERLMFIPNEWLDEPITEEENYGNDG